MMNFLDLSAASEEERRLIKEILADTSVVIPTAKTIKPTSIANNNQHQHKVINSNSNTNYDSSDISLNNQTSVHSQDTSTSSSSGGNSNSNNNNNIINNINNDVNSANDIAATTTTTTTTTITTTTTSIFNTSASKSPAQASNSNFTPSSNSDNSSHNLQATSAENNPTNSIGGSASSSSSSTSSSNGSRNQQIPSSAQAPLLPQSRVPPMAGDMNSVIGLDISSTQPQGYAIQPQHVAAFAPPIYGRPPIFHQPYHTYIIPYSYQMPYIIPPNSVVPPRQQVPPQSSQQPNINNTNNPHQRSHQHHISQQHHNQHHHQQQHHQQHHHHLQQQQQQQHHHHQHHNHHHHQQHAQQQHHHHLTHSQINHEQYTNNIQSHQQRYTKESNNARNPSLSQNALIREKKISEKESIDATDGHSSEVDRRYKDTRLLQTKSEKTKKLNLEIIHDSGAPLDSNLKTTEPNQSNIDKTKASVNSKLSCSPKLNLSNGVKTKVTSNPRADRSDSLMQRTEPEVDTRLNSENNISQNESAIVDGAPENSETKNLKNASTAEEDSAVEDTSDNLVQSDVSKYSCESSIVTNDNTATVMEKCNKTVDKSVSESTESIDVKNNETSLKTGVWGSAASKSWASLFKSGGNTLPGSSIDMDFNPSGVGNSDEDSRTQSTSAKGEVVQKSKNNSATSKEQRSQEAAQRALDKMGPRLAQKIDSINLKHSLPFLKLRGFINKGNGCYINATLQALIACPPFYNLMKEIGDLRGFRRDNSCTPILDSFAELFLNFPPLDSSKKNKVAPSQDQKMNISFLQAEAIEPKCIYNVLGRIKSECLKGAQEDAEEFLCSVLNGLHDEMIGLGEILQSTQNSTNQNGNPIDFEDSTEDINNDDNLWREVGTKNRSLPIRTAPVINTLIQEIFGGSLFSIRTAGKDRCGHRSPFFDLQLDISGDNVKSLQDAIKSFTATEIIHDFYCSKTKQKLDAQRRTSLDQLPPILILHLKQFVYSQDHGLKKLMKKIEYPIDFELPESCLNEKNSSDKGLRSSKSYKLLAVVYHEGKEAIKGHYLTDVYHIGSSQWIRCDDSNLKVIASPRIENPDSSRTPYLLFYRRLNTLRAQPGNHDNLNKKKS